MKMKKHHKCDHVRHTSETKFIVKKIRKIISVKVIHAPKPKRCHKHHTEHFCTPCKKHHEHHPRKPKKHCECWHPKHW